MNLTTNDYAAVCWTQLWQVTVLIVAVGVLVRLFCRHRPHLAYVLWMLVVVKCLTPPLWSSPTGVFSWAQGRVDVPAVPGGDGLDDEMADLFLGVDEPRASTVSPNETAERARWRSAPLAMLGVLWATGFVMLAMIVLFKWVGCYRLVKGSTIEADPCLQSLAADLCRRLGMGREPRLVVTSSDVGPAVLGVFRPSVLLPEAVLRGKDPQEIEPILAHELVHIRRGDTIFGALQVLAQLLWWFHPLVWWANRQASREAERCCDEEVVAGLGCRPAHYARCLLDVMKRKRSLQPVPGFPGVRPVEVTSRRLEDIMSRANRFHRRMPRWCWLVLLAGAALVLPGAGMTVGRDADSSSPAERQLPQAQPFSAEVDEVDLGSDRRLSDAVAQRDKETESQRSNQANARREKAAGDEAEAVAALKKLEARIRLDDNGKVIHVGLAKNTGVTDDTLLQLKAFSKLESLQLLGTQISDDGLEHLKGLTSLKDLRLGRTQITDSGLVHLKRLTNLEKLYLFGTQISDGGLIHLKNLQKLWDLNLRTTQITDAGLVHLEALPKLRSLVLNFTQITDAGLVQLKALPELRYLFLNSTQVTDAGLMHLEALPKLRSLQLSGDQFTDVGVKHLKKLTKLQSLNLAGDTTSDDSLAHLKELPKLESLTLYWTQVSDTGLVNLKRLPNLTSLSIWNTHVSDVGLEHVKALTNLKKLVLFQTNVTNGGVKKFKEALPDCETWSEGTYQPLKN